MGKAGPAPLAAIGGGATFLRGRNAAASREERPTVRGMVILTCSLSVTLASGEFRVVERADALICDLGSYPCKAHPPLGASGTKGQALTSRCGGHDAFYH